MSSDQQPHSFDVRVPKAGQRTAAIKGSDKAKLNESLAVERKEPPQVAVPFPSGDIAAELIAEENAQAARDKLKETKEKFEQWLRAAKQMSAVLGQRLRGRGVQVSSEVDPSVRESIGRLFKVDSDIVTYDMYKQALEIRSKLLAEQRSKDYGPSIPGSSSKPNTG